MKRYQRLVAIAAAALSACTSPELVAPMDSTNNAQIFDALWKEFDVHYSFFEAKGINWDSVGAIFRPQAIAAPNDAALARTLSHMLAGLRDRHVSLAPAGLTRSIAYLTTADSGVAPFDPGLVDRRYLTGAKCSQGGHVCYGLASPTVGYVRIPTFEGTGWVGELDEALASLRGAVSLIVDVRNNPGGTQQTAIEAAGRFATSSETYAYAKFRNGPKHSDFTSLAPQIVSPAGPTQFRGRVIVLTNRKVYSSGEDFVLATRVFPNVTTMGDTTAGASGRPMTRELPNGWTFQLSTWVQYTADRKFFENIGLAPDVYVAAERSDIVRGADPILDRALATLGVTKP